MINLGADLGLAQSQRENGNTSVHGINFFPCLHGAAIHFEKERFFWRGRLGVTCKDHMDKGAPLHSPLDDC